MVSGFTAEWDELINISGTAKSRDGTLWSISTSMYEFDSIVGWFIGLSALFGTIVWGYTEWMIKLITVNA